MPGTICENVNLVRARIAAAAKRAGRLPEDVTLVAVSKFMPAERIQEGYDAGLRHFGENHAQELRDKVGHLPGDINWHFIGSLQVNKVKYLVGRTRLIHSVDNLRQIAEIERLSARAGIATDVLVQVNVAGETQKSGIAPEEAVRFIEAAAACEHIRVRGLMTIPPIQPDAELTRPLFREMKALYDRLGTRFAGHDRVNFTTLSMGMSGDFEVAIEEGANLVRVGSAIFGPRTAPH